MELARSMAQRDLPASIRRDGLTSKTAVFRFTPRTKSKGSIFYSN